MCTCLLAVQNFFWKNSSFIWMPTAERGTIHWDIWWGMCMFRVLMHSDLYHKRHYPTGKTEIITPSQSASFINTNWGNMSTFIAANPCWTKWAKKAITPCVMHVSAYFSGRLTICVCICNTVQAAHMSTDATDHIQNTVSHDSRPHFSFVAHMKSIPFLSLPPCCYPNRPELVYGAVFTSISFIPAGPAQIWPEFLASTLKTVADIKYVSFFRVGWGKIETFTTSFSLPPLLLISSPSTPCFEDSLSRGLPYI